jgi:hypothetical protein
LKQPRQVELKKIPASSESDINSPFQYKHYEECEREEQLQSECTSVSDDDMDDDPTCFVAQASRDSSEQKKASDEGARYDSDSFLIVIDNGCSYCITNDVSHFVGTPEQIKISVKGIGGQKVVATLKGTVKWAIPNDDGEIHDELIPNTFYHAESPYCLYSPQHVAQVANDNFPERHGTYCATFDDSVELYWDQRTEKRTVKLDRATNIAIMRSAPSFTRFHAFCAAIDGDDITGTVPTDSGAMVTDDEGDENSKMSADDEDSVMGTPEVRRHPDLPDSVFLPRERTGNMEVLPTEDIEVQATTPQGEMLAWHYRLGHIPFSKIKQMATRGDLPARLANCTVPRCQACLFGKATRRAWRSKAPRNLKLPPTATSPGAVVSIDQMVSATPGLIAQMRGFLTRKRYTVTTVFVDHFSGLSFVYLQQTTTALETIEAKHAFERYAKLYGVSIKHYHADNGIFAAAEFVRAVEMGGQSISYCGVNAHHQNGRAEKKIRDLQDLARTMILHAQQRWPTAITANLWPYAVRMANDVSNMSPKDDGIAPIELFAQVAVAPRVKHSHTFGSPVYILDSKLQTAGQSVSKWSKKARIGIYLGASPRHSRKVALILSLETGHVSPQFHVVFDDQFETMRPSAGNKVPESKWQAATGFANSRSLVGNPRSMDQSEETAEIPDSEQTRWIGDLDQQTAPSDGIETEEINQIDTQDFPPHSQEDNLSARTTPQEMVTVPPHIMTRAGRVSRPTERWKESQEQQRAGLVALHVSWEVYHDGGYQIEEDLDDPIACLASTNPDIMYYDQALKEPDSKQFEEAMLKEVQDHTENEHWVITNRKDVPEGTAVLPAVWAMRRKRRITTGAPYKWKARLNLHGGKQEHGVNYWETYAPVIAWTTIRLFLVLVLLNGWKSRQVDFVLAYPQADIECPMYMEIPRGFRFNGSRKTHCLELKKNLYGQKQAGRVWNEYLHEGLIARGFVQSKVDMCLYYRGNVAMLIYTDDGIFIGPTSKEIDEVMALLKVPVTTTEGKFRAFNLTDEGDLCDYLGVKVEQLKNGCIKLSQPHLIQQIIADLGFNERTGTKPTPAASTIKLSRDLHGKPYREEWHYRSVIGKLNFVEKSTRPDIAYAVHQCARFSNDPKESHANAVKRIVKYLIATKDKGIILNPQVHSFDCWVDADFVGNWDRVNADVDPSTAKSRTGYVITYAGCPIAWASKLQSDVALSTTEAEYNALSTSLREVIHLMQLVEEAKELGWTTFTGVPSVHCTVFEDNSGCLEMARLPKMRPRTKHLCVRLHHFRERVRKKQISIKHVESKYQLADMLTKPQPEALFATQCNSVLQWDVEGLADLTSHLRACDNSGTIEGLNNGENQQDMAIPPGESDDVTGLTSSPQDTIF